MNHHDTEKPMTLTNNSFHLAVAVMKLLVHLLLARQVLQLLGVRMLFPNNEINNEHEQPVCDTLQI